MPAQKDTVFLVTEHCVTDLSFMVGVVNLVTSRINTATKNCIICDQKVRTLLIHFTVRLSLTMLMTSARL